VNCTKSRIISIKKWVQIREKVIFTDFYSILMFDLNILRIKYWDKDSRYFG
jgi:hypothetical protein